MSDIYQAPKSKLTDEHSSNNAYGSIEKGINGDYEFDIGQVLNEAWQKTRGAKGTFWLAFLIYFAISIGIAVVSQIVLVAVTMNVQGEGIIVLISIIEQVIMNLVLLPVMAGIFILGIRRSVDAPIQAGSVVGYYSSMWRLFFTLLLIYLMVLVGFVLLIIPGIYLAVAYYMAMPLVVEKGLSPWEAMEISRKTISKRWFTTFFFGIALGLVLLVSALPLGIGLVWTLPMSMIAYGIIYRNMFGVSNDTLA